MLEYVYEKKAKVRKLTLNGNRLSLIAGLCLIAASIPVAQIAGPLGCVISPQSIEPDDILGSCFGVDLIASFVIFGTMLIAGIVVSIFSIVKLGRK
jgi:hypothetical protein